jgi:hypothetical protein
MNAKTKAPRKHSGNHNFILPFLKYCIEQGDKTYEAAAYRIYENEWMDPKASKTGANFDMLKLDCKRTWDKAVSETEAGVTPQKRLKDFEKLRVAKEWVDSRVTYDIFTNQYLSDNKITNHSSEYNAYNTQADDKTFIEKHFFQNAFECDDIVKFSSLKKWGESLPKADKTDWIKKLVTFIPAVDPVQAELYLKGWLIRVYIQAVNPKNQDDNSIVNRWFLILHQQRQESGKSAFFRWIAPDPKWVKGNGLEDNKDAYLALCRYMLVLDDELGGLSRIKQQERIKSMVSSSKIDVRPHYGKVDLAVSRTASFCGSTNHDDIFPPSEGTTRFLMLPLKDSDFGWEKYITQIDKVKLWAQVKQLAATEWLKKNTPAIIKYRDDTNTNYIKEDLECFVVSRFMERDDSSPIVLTAGEIMRTLCDTDYGYNNLNINRLGQALKKEFGERVDGLSKGNKRTKGYKIKILPASLPTPTLYDTEKGNSDTEKRKKSMKSKTKNLFQK